MKKQHNHSVLVLGLGLSGTAAASLLLSQGAKVYGIDQNIPPDTKNPIILPLITKGLTILPSNQSPLPYYDQLIVSPGISPTHPIYQKSKQNNIEILGEAELGFRFLPQNTKVIGITGTNGKTTVSLLVEHVLKSSGISCKAVGNIGAPLCEAVLSKNTKDILIVELSSFQLETLTSQVFDSAAILNITPDHLDRYPSMTKYAQAKWQLSKCLKNGAPLFYSENIKYLPFPIATPPKNYFSICLLASSSLQFSKSCNKKEVDRENALAAFSLCQPFGISENQFLTAWQSFTKPPHRLEFIKTINGINIYNDSKATNLEAVISAVESFPSNIHLIAGGVAKEKSFTRWKESFKNKVQHIYAIGEAAPTIYTDLSRNFPTTTYSSLQTATTAALKYANPRDVILLSPGCASFDAFKNYAERGQAFKEIIKNTHPI